VKKCPHCDKQVTPKDDTCPECGKEMKVSEEAEGALIQPGNLDLLVEAAEVIVPKRGKLFEERVIEGGHKVKVARFAIIRPCQSKGRRIGGHAPIYEPRMLAENASVFTGWPMYLDHMSEELAEAFAAFLQERGRSMKDLGGRVLKSFYDPEVSMESDEENGYRKGAVVGEIIPQKIVREMLEEDPFALAVSINAWPKGARVGTASWDSSVKGAVIEGIRSKPMGSVDFVPRGGAGGRLLSEEEIRSAVSLLESAYTAARDDEQPDRKERPVKKKLSEMSGEEVAALTSDQLQEALREENPDLAEQIQIDGGEGPAREGDATKPLTQADLDSALNEQREALVEEFGDSKKAAEEMAEELVEEREQLRSLADLAAEKIGEAQRNGLPKAYADEIRKNYLLLPSGPRAGLQVEEREDEESGKTLKVEEVLEEQIRADVETAVRLIEAAGGEPRVKGLGPTGKTEEVEEGKKAERRKALREGSAFTDFLGESGDLTGDAEKDDKRVREMVEG
jgi:hypothetical protein